MPNRLGAVPALPAGRDLIGLRRTRSGLVQLHPVPELQAVEHVHYFEFQAARLRRIAVPQRHHAALELRIEQDQRTIATDAAAMADDVVPGIFIASPAIAILRFAQALEELPHASAFTWRLHPPLVNCIEQLGTEH